MGKITIYLSLKDGELVYRDSEDHKGQTITTKVDPGDKITWKLDQCSGIKEITNIAIKGPEGFFKDGPEKKDFDTWKAEVSKKAKGVISYIASINECDANNCSYNAKKCDIVNDPDAPKIEVDD